MFAIDRILAASTLTWIKTCKTLFVKFSLAGGIIMYARMESQYGGENHLITEAGTMRHPWTKRIGHWWLAKSLSRLWFWMFLSPRMHMFTFSQWAPRTPALRMCPTINISELWLALNCALRYFGVFDGHGGAKVAAYCANNLHRLTFKLQGLLWQVKHSSLHSGT